MEREMRRRDRLISEQEAMEILVNGEYGVLSTMGTEYPYGVPVNYAAAGHSIYIHGSCETGLKAENLAENDHVCFTVVGKTEVLAEKFSEKYESAIAFGKAEAVEGPEKEAALKALIEKYSAAYMESGMKYIQNAKDSVVVYRIEIEHLTGKAHR